MLLLDFTVLDKHVLQIRSQIPENPGRRLVSMLAQVHSHTLQNPTGEVGSVN
jgi:hypothetical protein